MILTLRHAFPLQGLVHDILIGISAPSPARISARASRHGELRLRFARRGGQTILAESFFRTPMQVMRAVPDAADVLTVYLLSPTGGVVDGDHYQFDLCLEAGTHALVTTQAATKVYRTPTDGAAQQARIMVGEGATLELLPDALILFAGADYAQEIQITLAPGALLVLHEIVMPGRLARGEVLAFRRFRSRLTVRDQAGLLLVDAVDYAPDPGDAARPGLLDGGPCWGSWYLLGDLAGRGVDATAFCTAHQAALEATPGAVAGISPLWRGGVTARALAPTTGPLYAAFSLLWAAFRSEVMGLPASIIRK